ncbi:MAG: methionine synthase [Thermotogaceae bacterium]|nr:methionine synthase [Thermotogaceae bacterium]
MSETFKVDPKDIEVPERVLAARLGFKGLGKIPDDFKESLEKAYSIALRVARPVAIYETFPSKDRDDGVEINGKFISGKLAKSQLSGSRKVTVLLATLGKDFDEKIEELHRKGEELLSFFLDGIGSEMVEYLARKLDSFLREKYGQGSARISPGYVDLQLSLNAWIIDTLKGSRIEVTCDPQTHIMKPRKTISALIGWK